MNDEIKLTFPLIALPTQFSGDHRGSSTGVLQVISTAFAKI